MTGYVTPLKDMNFVLHHLARMDEVLALPAYQEHAPDVVDAILEQAGRFAEQVIAPLNRVADKEGLRFKDGTVTMPSGFRDAYKQYVESGWASLAGETEFGGQGLPRVVCAPIHEMWKSAALPFSAVALLTQGAMDALVLGGSDELKHRYLPRMIEGRWTGTMNLTEPQAGSDLAAVRTTAQEQPDGSYRISGRKIFITFCEHDLAENIVHLVLARTADGAEGVKGISLFLVPKFLVNEDGSLGKRNDVHCVSLEHKLGSHGSPTGVVAFGDEGGATGYLVGEKFRGIEYMFVMMNAARFGVGLEGLGVSERAYQQALGYARERVQGKDIEGSAQSVAIIRHPDVRRMLLMMKSQIEAMRALDYVVAAAQDLAVHHPDPEVRTQQQGFVDLMIPIVKGWGTETAIDIANLGIQIHGGMGYVEETGAAQYLRDVRITAIYEGTTGIQANDLMGRKVARGNGVAIRAVIAQMHETGEQLQAVGTDEFKALATLFARGVQSLEEATHHILENFGKQRRAVSVGAVPFLKLFGVVSGGWMLARSALAARVLLAKGGEDVQFYVGKIATARFYASHILTTAPGLRDTVVIGGEAGLALADEAF